MNFFFFFKKSIFDPPQKFTFFAQSALRNDHCGGFGRFKAFPRGLRALGAKKVNFLGGSNFGRLELKIDQKNFLKIPKSPNLNGDPHFLGAALEEPL